MNADCICCSHKSVHILSLCSSTNLLHGVMHACSSRPRGLWYATIVPFCEKATCCHEAVLLTSHVTCTDNCAGKCSDEQPASYVR